MVGRPGPIELFLEKAVDLFPRIRRRIWVVFDMVPEVYTRRARKKVERMRCARIDSQLYRRPPVRPGAPSFPGTGRVGPIIPVADED